MAVSLEIILPAAKVPSCRRTFEAIIDVAGVHLSGYTEDDDLMSIVGLGRVALDKELFALKGA